MSCTPSWPHLISIVKESVVEEAMGQEEVAADDGKVEELAEDKPAKVDIVPEERHKIMNISTFYCLSNISWVG